MNATRLAILILLTSLLPQLPAVAAGAPADPCLTENGAQSVAKPVLQSIQGLSAVLDDLTSEQVPNCGVPAGSPFGGSPKDQSSPPSPQLELAERSLLVVHAHENYGLHSLQGMNELLKTVKARGENVVFMLENSELKTWITDDRKANFICDSIAGQHTFNVKTPEFIMAGGLMSACLGEAARLAVLSALSNTKGPIVVHYPMDAITTPKGRLADNLVSANDKNREFLLDLTWSLREYWKKRSVHVKISLDGKEVPSGQAIGKNDRVLEMKFWSSTLKFRGGT